MLEIFPAASSENVIRVEFFDDEIDRISEINHLTGELVAVLKHVAIYPASHYVSSADRVDRAIDEIKAELAQRVKIFQRKQYAD